MIHNLLLTAFRSLGKNKFFSLLNISGLAIGIAVFLLIAQYVHFERSYENFIPERENIYRVKLEMYSSNELTAASAENYPGVAPAMKAELPEVVDYARLYNMGYKNNVVITYKEAKPQPVTLLQRHFFYADSSFLPMMNYKMVKGNAATALGEPLTAVISEDYAKIYFRNEDPIGKTLLLQDDDYNYEPVTVTGVFKNLPANTHVKFDILFSYKTLFTRGKRSTARFSQGWGRKEMYSFVQLREGTDTKKLEAKLPALVDKYKPELKQSQQKNVLSLQPLKDIHLKSELTEEAESNGNYRIVLFISIIGVFVLVIAWINYVNLATARALERAKEVGVRKVIGAVKNQLILQFLAEAALVNFISIIFACILVTIALPYFNTLSGLSIAISDLWQPWFLLLTAGLLIAGTFLSGLYPAFILSSFKPIIVLKGKMADSTRGILLRKGLVVTQFVASIVLIAGTVIVYRQLNFMMNRDLGMNIDQVLIVPRPAITDTSEAVFNSSVDVFRNEVRKNAGIEGITSSLTIPGRQRVYQDIIKKPGSNDSITVRTNSMDNQFIDVFKMKLLAGRPFSVEHPENEKNSIIITESASRMLGFSKPTEAINQLVEIPLGRKRPVTVIGVVNDYHQLSLKKIQEPGAFYCSQYGGGFYAIRVNTKNLAQAVEHIQHSWSKAFSGNPFEYYFLDDFFNQQYTNERKFGKLFTTFAVLAIIIGCVGLFGLSSYMASQRIKEIGIRKVLGASVIDITTMLSKDFLKLILLAIIIATPVAWFTMSLWLQDFAYRINIGWWIFLVAGAIALLIAMITISYQAVKAAVANPVKSLRTE